MGKDCFKGCRWKRSELNGKHMKMRQRTTIPGQIVILNLFFLGQEINNFLPENVFCK